MCAASPDYSTVHVQAHPHYPPPFTLLTLTLHVGMAVMFSSLTSSISEPSLSSLLPHSHSTCRGNHLYDSPCPNMTAIATPTPLQSLYHSNCASDQEIIEDTYSQSIPIPTRLFEVDPFKGFSTSDLKNLKLNSYLQSSSGRGLSQRRESADSTFSSMSQRLSDAGSVDTISLTQMTDTDSASVSSLSASLSRQDSAGTSSNSISSSNISSITSSPAAQVSPPLHSQTLPISSPPSTSSQRLRARTRPSLDMSRINQAAAHIKQAEDAEERESYQLLKPIFDYRRERQNQMAKIEEGKGPTKTSTVDLGGRKPVIAKMQALP